MHFLYYKMYRKYIQVHNKGIVLDHKRADSKEYKLARLWESDELLVIVISP